MPVALVDHSTGSATLYYIHTDHLNRPQKITDASATIVWDGAFDPFGKRRLGHRHPHQPAALPRPIPGHRDNLAQNWFRDYDSTIGRYCRERSDQVAGGANTFGYAYGNPMRFTDASGKCPICFAILLAPRSAPAGTSAGNWALRTPA
ncbi:MAG: RHS domain-containing protein [Rhizomicrobium sp.]